MLEYKDKMYKKEKLNVSLKDMLIMLPSLKEKYPFMKEIDSCICQNSVKNLYNAFERFYKGNGYPKYKKKGIKESFKTNNIINTYKDKTYNSIKLDLINKTVTLPKIGNIKVRGYRNKEEINAKIINANVSKKADKYYVSIVVKEEVTITNKVHTKIVGIDLGIKDMVVTSNGEKINNENKERLERLNKRLKGLNKALSRSKKDSNNRRKLINKINRIYMKINNMKKHTINEISNKIVKENDIICMESLDIKSMYQNHNIAKRLVNIPLYNLINTIKWKSKLLNKKFIQINKYYKSSRKCNKCGKENKKVKDLSIRKWECENCGTLHDRDINAGINIMFEGLKIYMKEMYA